MAGLGERKKRLHAAAQRLVPRPKVMPYYLHRPQGRSEPAPGWYFVPAGELDHPVYLGFGAVPAEIALIELLDRQEQEQPA